jgi:hypothetical protein
MYVPIQLILIFILYTDRIFVAGLFSGNVAVLHSVLGELTDASNQAIAFPIYGLTWPLGAIIGFVGPSSAF